MSQLPKGFRVAGVASGIKADPSRLDLSLVVSDRACSAAGVFTQNRVAAAPVQISRGRVPADAVRAIIVNSGNANACTGERGLADARKMSELVAQRLGCAAEAVLVCSTGVIGEPLPMQAIESGLPKVFELLGSDTAALESAARGIMTTDTVPKTASHSVDLPGGIVRVTGIAKGAAMIGPNMATMLAFIFTDGAIESHMLQPMLREAADQTFNMISVEGHTSTNDTVLALANGASGVSMAGREDSNALARAVADTCRDLAQAIVRDAEGAKHVITIDVAGLRTADEAKRVARAIANSALVKTAIYGADPNWGRIVSAAGYAGVEFEERDCSLWLDDTLLYERGTPVVFDARAVSERLRATNSAAIRMHFQLGDAACRFWTSDLTEEYIRLNADYRT